MPYNGYPNLTMSRNTNPKRHLFVGYWHGTFGTGFAPTLGYSLNNSKYWYGISYDPPSVTADSIPTAGDFRLNSKYFGTHLSGGGVLYAWEQGQGW